MSPLLAHKIWTSCRGNNHFGRNNDNAQQIIRTQSKTRVTLPSSILSDNFKRYLVYTYQYAPYYVEESYRLKRKVRVKEQKMTILQPICATRLSKTIGILTYGVIGLRSFLIFRWRRTFLCVFTPVCRQALIYHFPKIVCHIAHLNSFTLSLLF